MTFAYGLISNYTGGISKFIHKYQGSDKAFLGQIAKIKALKGTDVVQVSFIGREKFPILKYFPR